MSAGGVIKRSQPPWRRKTRPFSHKGLRHLLGQSGKTSTPAATTLKSKVYQDVDRAKENLPNSHCTQQKKMCIIVVLSYILHQEQDAAAKRRAQIEKERPGEDSNPLPDWHSCGVFYCGRALAHLLIASELCLFVDQERPGGADAPS